MFTYEREKDKPETLKALGPTSEDLTVMVHRQFLFCLHSLHWIVCSISSYGDDDNNDDDMSDHDDANQVMMIR